MSEQISGLGDILTKSLESMKELAGTNTIIGEPMNLPGGTVIIPISKVAIGIASGGLDSAGVNGTGANSGAKNPQNGQQKPTHNKKFTGGGGSGVSVTPVGFLVVKANGDVEMLNVGMTAPQTTAESVVGLIEHSPELIQKLKDVVAGFTGKKADKNADLEPEEDA